MAIKCSVCGKKVKRYFTTSQGNDVCSKACYGVYQLEAYLLWMEENRQKNETLNKRSYDEAREMSSLISLYKFGNREMSKCAKKILAKHWCNIAKIPWKDG